LSELKWYFHTNILVFAPAGQRENLSVLVYIYPGAFKDGFKDFKVYLEGGEKLSQSNVIVVTINYRGGAFGFLPAEELAETGDLNIGLQDIVMAFKWVRENIGEFGGNSRKVTAFGLSAGGLSIGSLIVAKDGKMDLFDRAFMMSGSLIPILESPSTTSPIVNELARNLNCDLVKMSRMDCLRHASSSQLLEASVMTNRAFNNPVSTIYGPVMDGNLFKRQQYESLDAVHYESSKNLSRCGFFLT
jgi:carboxylesterase type B